jgi:MFS family permease
MERWIAFIQRRFYYGWAIVGLAMVSMSFWFGLRTTFSVFFVALIGHFGWSRAETAGAQSVSLLVYMVMAPAVGILVDRIGPRNIVLTGTLLLGAGLLLCTRINSLFHFYLFFGVIAGAGVTCLSIAPFTVILSHWFEKKRGTANGWASVGMGLGTFLFVPFIQSLISFHGWRFAYLILSVLVFTIPLPLIALFLRHRPEEMGIVANGVTPVAGLEKESWGGEKKRWDAGPAVTPEKGKIRDLMKTRRFWSFLLFPATMVLGVYIVIVHHVKYLVDLGVEGIWAASLFGATGALSAVFRIFWGWLSDRIGREITFTLGGSCFILGILSLILFQKNPSPSFLWFFAFFFGAGWGSTAPMFMSIAGDLYKGRHFGLIYGLLEGMIGIGAAAGSWVAGYIFDQTQSYSGAFTLAILSCAISVLLVWHVAPRKFRRTEPTPSL